MANANLFQQYLQPVRSVADYAGDMDRQEANQLALAASRRQNVAQEDAATQQTADRNALQRIASGWSADTTPDQRIAALRNSGRPGLMTQADTLEDQHVKRQKAAADAGETNTKTLKSRMELSKQGLEMVRTPQDFMAWHEANHRDPVLGAYFKERGIKAEDSLAQINQALQTPGGFEQLLRQSQLGLDKAMENHFTSQDTGGGGRVVVQPKFGAGPAVVAPGSEFVKAQSPDSVASNATSVENNKRTVSASLENAGATRAVAQATRDAANAQRDQATEMKLADDYRAQSKSFGEASSAYKQINATLDSATTSPAATLAAATKFMKILDPGSVVRESELGMALAATGVIDRAQNYVNSLRTGKVLTAAQVADFKDISKKMYAAAQGVQQSIDADYKGKAKAYNLRPEMVTQDLGQNSGGPVPTDIAQLLQKHGGK